MSTPTTANVSGADPFGAPNEAEGATWLPVSVRLAAVRRISVLIPLAVIELAGVVALLILTPLWLAVLAGVVAILVVLWASWLIGRQVRATGYALRTDDLLVVSGIMFRRLVIVPYGRMQLVDVSRGPLDRHFGLATVQLHTAAATTDATVPGLPLSEAAALRDKLAALGEQRSAGI